VEGFDRSPNRAFARLERGKGALAVGAGERACLGDGGVAARRGKLEQDTGGHEWCVDGQNDAEVGWRCTESCGQPEDRCALGVTVVEDREREVERVLGLADGQPVGTGFAQRAPSALAEGLAFVDGERFWRAEACASAADE
jgi:hypothetical protein